MSSKDSSSRSGNFYQKKIEKIRKNYQTKSVSPKKIFWSTIREQLDIGIPLIILDPQ